LLDLVVDLGVWAVGSEGRAQVQFWSISDAFFAYSSFYLPRQQAQALSPGPQATIHAITAKVGEAARPIQPIASRARQVRVLLFFAIIDVVISHL